MSKIPDGYQNEFLFVLEFNNKKVEELNPLLRNVIDDIFPNIDKNKIIKSWRNHNNYEKADIFIKIDNNIKIISIKKGSRNSVHVESLKDFKKFLKEANCNDKIIDKYISFHYGIDKDDNNKILSSKEYNKKYSTDISEINKELLKLNIDKVIDRFILSGNHSSYQVNGIIYGTPEDFLWINRNQIIEILKSHISNTSSSIHISDLYIQPMNRCINNNEKYAWCRDYIQVKWYNLFDDIIEIMNKRLNY